MAYLPYEGFTVTLSSGSTSHTVTLPESQKSTKYVVVGTINNLVDANPAFIPLCLTAKTLTTFTISWNMPLNTANYTLDFMVNI